MYPNLYVPDYCRIFRNLNVFSMFQFTLILQKVTKIYGWVRGYNFFKLAYLTNNSLKQNCDFEFLIAEYPVYLYASNRIVMVLICPS